jgi:YbbR domain-containing protein
MPRWRQVGTPVALAVLSLLAAIVLWVAVSDAENPPRLAVFSGGIQVVPVNVPEGLAVASIRSPTVSLRISAPQDEFNKLVASDFKAEVDLSGVRQPLSDHVVIASVISKENVEIVEISPGFVTVTLEQVTSKQVPVEANLVGTPPQGFSVGPPEASPSTVTVTGAASLIQLVSRAVADVNLTGLRLPLTQQYILTARDTRGVNIRGVSVVPGVADIKAVVVQQQLTLPLAVLPSVQGGVADGYNLLSVTVEPPTVGVSGPLAQLQAIPYLTTDAIDVSGLRADVTRSVRLRVPAGLSVTRDSVNVRLHVMPAPGQISLTLTPQVTNLADGLRASLQTASITVHLSGELPTLRTLTPSSVKANVNAEGLGEGVQVIKPTISVPDGVQVSDVDPAQVVVVLRR